MIRWKWKTAQFRNMSNIIHGNAKRSEPHQEKRNVSLLPFFLALLFLLSLSSLCVYMFCILFHCLPYVYDHFDIEPLPLHVHFLICPSIIFVSIQAMLSLSKLKLGLGLGLQVMWTRLADTR